MECPFLRQPFLRQLFLQCHVVAGRGLVKLRWAQALVVGESQDNNDAVGHVFELDQQQ